MQGTELKALRKQAGMTQAEVAEALGMTQTYVGLMERGEAPIEKRTERMIQEILRARIDVSFSAALEKWVVSILRHERNRRVHHIDSAHQLDSQAHQRAEQIAAELPGARILVHPRRP